jgi:hypothetical protein
VESATFRAFIVAIVYFIGPVAHADVTTVNKTGAAIPYLQISEGTDACEIMPAGPNTEVYSPAPADQNFSMTWSNTGPNKQQICWRSSSTLAGITLAPWNYCVGDGPCPIDCDFCNVSLISPRAATTGQQQVEGLFLQDNQSTAPRPPATSTFGTFGEGRNFFSGHGPIVIPATSYTKTLASWIDPFTMPHTRMGCVKWASGSWPWGGGWKTCIGWKTQFQWLHNTLYLKVSSRGLSFQSLQAEVNQCLAIATDIEAAALLIELLETVGVAAAQTTAQVASFTEILQDCLVAKFATDAISISIPLPPTSQWGDWQ